MEGPGWLRETLISAYYSALCVTTSWTVGSLAYSTFDGSSTRTSILSASKDHLPTKSGAVFQGNEAVWLRLIGNAKTTGGQCPANIRRIRT